MDLRCAQSVWGLCNVLLLFTFFYGKSSSVVLSDLSRVCVYFFPFNTECFDTMIPPNGFCTAVATCKEFGYHPQHENFDYNTFKGGLPYVYVYDHKHWKSIKKKIHPNNVKQFIDELDELITDNKIDVMVFDFLENKLVNTEYSEKFQTHLKSFFNTMRNNHKNMLFGLKLHRDADKNEKEFNVKFVDEAIDFYVVETYDYNDCIYNAPNKMAKPPSPVKMQKSINDLRNIGYDARKLFLTVQIVVKAWKNNYRRIPTYWSYSWICQAEPEKESRFCRASLNNFYLQAKVAFHNQLPGVFLQSINFDDYDSACGCGHFPATQAIHDGSCGFPKNITITGCKTFGLLPEERRHRS